MPEARGPGRYAFHRPFSSLPRAGDLLAAHTLPGSEVPDARSSSGTQPRAMLQPPAPPGPSAARPSAAPSRWAPRTRPRLIPAGAKEREGPFPPPLGLPRDIAARRKDTVDVILQGRGHGDGSRVSPHTGAGNHLPRGDGDDDETPDATSGARY